MTDVELYQPPPLDERGLALIERQAAVIAKSSLVGKDLRGKTDDVVLVGINAQALGVPFMTGITDLFPIEGKITISARLRVGLARRAGHEVWFDESTDEQATCCLRRRGERRIHRLTYTFAQASKAKLTGKDNWAKHPAAMLRAAAARQLVAMAAQDVMLGIPNYVSDADLEAAGVDIDDLDTPEELMAGDDIPPTNDVAPIQLAGEDEKKELLARIGKLKPHQREWLHAELVIPGSDPDRPAFRLPSLRSVKMQRAIFDEYKALVDEAARQVKPGPSPEQIQATIEQAIAEQTDDDPGRPF